MSVALPFFVTRGGIPELPPLDEGLTQRLLEAANRNELSDEEQAAIQGVCARVEDPSAFLVELIERWQFKGVGEGLMTNIFSWLATEREVLWLGDMVRKQKPWREHVWDRTAARRRGLKLLAAVDSALAWLEVQRVEDSTRAGDLFSTARDLRYKRTRDAELTWGLEDELAAPDLGFVEGVRSVAADLRIVARDPDSVRFVRDDGRSFANPPRGVTDRAFLKLLTEAVDQVFERGADRLERAMVTGRSWDHFTWRSAWFEHGLLGVFARRVVWRGRSDSGDITFFINEEREAVKWDGMPVVLDAIWAFEVAHPTSLQQDWQSVFADHEIVQPFEQIHRHAKRSRGDVNPHTLIAAQRWGWERRGRHTGKARDVLVLTTADHTVRLSIHPGIRVADAGRPTAHQVSQTIMKTVVSERDSGKELPHAQWPALIEFEIELLRRRAAL